MGRKKNKKIQFTEKDTLNVLLKGTSGVLALIGKDGYPYTITVGYVCSAGKIYFRGATVGESLDEIKNNDKASFCVINKSNYDKETNTVVFSTALAFGNIKTLSSVRQKQQIVDKLNAKYAPDKKEEPKADGEEETKPSVADINILQFSIEHLRGQQSTEFINIPGSKVASKPAVPQKKSKKAKGDKDSEEKEAVAK